MDTIVKNAKNVVNKVINSAKEVIKDNPRFTKEALINSKKYNTKKDVINTLVKANEKLTIEEMDKRLDEFYKKGVN